MNHTHATFFFFFHMEGLPEDDDLSEEELNLPPEPVVSCFTNVSFEGLGRDVLSVIPYLFCFTLPVTFTFVF